MSLYSLILENHGFMNRMRRGSCLSWENLEAEMFDYIISELEKVVLIV